MKRALISALFLFDINLLVNILSTKLVIPMEALCNALMDIG